jgi:hypothetical protein
MRIGTICLGGLLGAAVVTYVVARSENASAEAPPATKAAELAPPLAADLFAPIDVTAQDEKLVKLLEKKISLDVKEKPLEEVIQQIGKLMGANFVFDRATLANNFVKLTKPVSLQVHDVPARRVLGLILNPFELTCVIEDRVLLIIEEVNAESHLVTRLYPVADLAGSAPPDHIDDVVNELIEVIQGTVASDMWADNGGNGTIDFSSVTLTFVVTAKSHVHEGVQVLLTKLREAQGRAKAQLRAAGLPEMSALQKTLHDARQKTRKRLVEELRREPQVSPPTDDVEALRRQAADAHRVAEKSLRLALQLEKELANLKAERKSPVPSEKTKK